MSCPRQPPSFPQRNTVSIRTHLSASAGVTLLLAASGVLLVASPAAAVTYPVSTEAELIAAINDANASTTVDDTISITGTITLSEDLPSIRDSVSIVGAGSGATTIDSNGYYGLEIYGTTGDRQTVLVQGVTLENATFNGIESSETNITLSDVRIDSAVNYGMLAYASNVTVTNSVFTNSSTGLYVYNSGNTVQISSSAFNDNLNLGLNVYSLGAATTTVSNVTADSNDQEGVFFQTSGPDARLSASGITATNSLNAAGVDINADTGAVATVSNVTSSGNRLGGIGLYPYGAEISLAGAQISNTPGGSGLVVSANADSRVTVSDVTTTGSNDFGVFADAYSSIVELAGLAVTGEEDGVSLSAYGGAAVTLSSSTLSGNDNAALQISGSDASVTVQSTTLDSNNVLTSGSPLGALRVFNNDNLDVLADGVTVSNNDRDTAVSATLGDGSSFRLVNSTVSGNSGVTSSVELLSAGAAVVGASVDILNSTITQNTASEPDFGGGVIILDVPTSIRNSIVAGNTADEIQVEDRFGTVEALTIDYSLVQSADATGESALAAGTGNVVDVPAQLGPLANNGGPTLTHLPLTGSPVLNAGDPSSAGAPAADQRGLARIAAGRIDIGAVEVQLPSALAATGIDPTVPVGIGALLLLAGALLLRRRVRAAQ